MTIAAYYDGRLYADRLVTVSLGTETPIALNEENKIFPLNGTQTAPNGARLVAATFSGAADVIKLFSIALNSVEADGFNQNGRILYRTVSGHNFSALFLDENGGGWTMKEDSKMEKAYGAATVVNQYVLKSLMRSKNSAKAIGSGGQLFNTLWCAGNANFMSTFRHALNLSDTCGGDINSFSTKMTTIPSKMSAIDKKVMAASLFNFE